MMESTDKNVPLLVAAVATLAVALAASVMLLQKKRHNAASDTNIPMNDKCILITGCDTGFGALLAKRAH